MDIQGISDHNSNIKRGILLIGGWLSAVISLIAYPFVFGMLGVVMGILATKNNKSRIGLYLVVSAILLMGVGLAFSSKILYTAKCFLGI